MQSLNILRKKSLIEVPKLFEFEIAAQVRMKRGYD
jgi:hypothetical protein